jgi:hypothetical protein
MIQRIFAVIALGALAGVTACSSSGGGNSYGPGPSPAPGATIQTVRLPTSLSLTANVPVTQTLAVDAYDASGALITGSELYANPIVLSDSDKSGATLLSVNGGTGSSSVTVNAPTDVVKLAYNGRALASFSLSASGQGFSNSATLTPSRHPITFTGTTLDTISPSDPNYKQPTVFFSNTGQIAKLTFAELGWSNAPYNGTFAVALDSATCKTATAPVAAVSTTDHLTFSSLSENVGICKATATDGIGGTATVWLSVSTTSIGVH